MARLVQRQRPKAFTAKHLHGWTPWSVIKDKDPSRFYVLANKTLEGVGSVEHYESIGYVVERHRKGGPHFAATSAKKSADGDIVSMRELVLMSIPIDSEDESVLTHKLLEQYGPDGVTGQAWYDEKMAHISDPGPNGLNPLQNLNLGTSDSGRPYMTTENETGPLQATHEIIQR